MKIKREADDEDHVFVSPSFNLTTCDAGCGPSSAVDYDGGPLPVEIKPELGDYQHVTESEHMIRSSHDGQKPMCLKNSEIGSVEDGRSSAFSGCSVAQAVKDETHDYMHGRVTFESPLPCSSNKPHLRKSHTSNATIPREASLPSSRNKSYTLKDQTSTQTKPWKPPQLCSRNKPHVLQSQTDDENTPREPPSPCSTNQHYLMQNNASHETTLRGEPLPCSSNKSYLFQNHASNVTMPWEAPLRCSSNKPYLLQSHTSTDTIQCEPPLLDSRNKPYLLQSHTSSENTPCPSTKPYLMQNQASNGTLPRKHPQPFFNKKPCLLLNDASNESEPESFDSVRRELKDNGDNAQSDRGPWDPPAKRPELNTEKNGKRKPASNAKNCKARSNVSVATRSYQPKLVCFDCSVTFNCQTDILTHRCRGESQTDVHSSPSEKTVQRTHTGRNPNPSHRLFCRFCRSGFTHPRNLRKHLGNGSSPRYKCIECSEPFCLQKALEDHVLSRHNDTFMCRLCETFFATGRSLSKHMARHEPEDTDTERFYPEDEGKQNEPSASHVAQTSQSSESFSMQQPPTFPPVSQASNKMVPTETSLDNSQPGEPARACTNSAPKAPSPNEPSETLRQLCRAVSEVSSDRLQPSHAVSLPSFASPTQPVRLPHSFRLDEKDPRSSTRSDNECSPLDEPTQPVRQTETRTNGADKGHQESAADSKGYGLQENNIPPTQRAQEVDTFGSATFDLHNLHFQRKRDVVSMDLSDEKGELVTEEETAAADRAYVCIECDSWFSHKAQLEAHLLDADGFNIPLSCYVCKQSFLCLDALTKHVQLHKTDVKRKDHWKKSEGPSSCGVPSSSQTRSSDLCDCIFTEKNEIENDVCEVLEDTPGSPPERYSVHQSGEIFDSAKTPASCKCKHTSKRCKSVPQRTQTLPEGAPRKKYKPESGVRRRHRCSLCPAAFQRASHLKTHIRVHTGERPYQCPDCGSSFKENGGLKRHSRVHTRERPYACEACGKDFTDASSLRRHLTSPAHKWTIRQLQWALDSAAEMERCYGAGQDE